MARNDFRQVKFTGQPGKHEAGSPATLLQRHQSNGLYIRSASAREENEIWQSKKSWWVSNRVIHMGVNSILEKSCLRL